MIDTILQWTGFFGIAIGYMLIGTYRNWGALLSLIGSVAFAVWCFLQPEFPFGMFFLQMWFVGVNLHYLRIEYKLWKC